MMPVPAYRYPNLVQPQALEIPRIYGGGLLGRAYGLPPPGGLLQPAMWDRVRQQQGLLGTEGGGRGMEGGGGRGFTPGPAPAPGELPLHGGGMRSGGEKPRYNWNWNESYREYTTVLPKTGMKVTAIPSSNYNRADAEGVARRNMSVQFS